MNVILNSKPKLRNQHDHTLILAGAAEAAAGETEITKAPPGKL
jgi:hypothetical protein